MYNNPYDNYNPQMMNPMNMNQMNMNPMEGMQAPGYQMPFYNQMPTMPMQPMQPMQPMGTVMGATQAPMGGMKEVQGTTSGTMPTNVASIPLAVDQFGGTPITDIQYTQGYLRTQIGQRVKVEFLIGTNMLVDREGTLTDVGISYIIINEVETDDLLLCDIYSIKFVRFYF